MKNSSFHISMMGLWFQGFISLGKFRKHNPVPIPFIASGMTYRVQEERTYGRSRNAWEKEILLFLYKYSIYVVTLFSGNTKGPSASAEQRWLNAGDAQQPLPQIPFRRAGSSWWHCHFVNKEVWSCESTLFQNSGQDARVLGKTFPLWVLSWLIVASR